MSLRDTIFGKPKVTVSAAAGGFIMVMFERAEVAWPMVKKMIVGFGKPFEADDDAQFNLFLVGVALHLNAVHNLFPAQAKEIEAEIYRVLSTQSHGDYPVKEVRYYRSLLAKPFDDPRDAHTEAAVHLLRRWMDGDISDFVGAFDMVDPLTLMAIMSATVDLGGDYWKIIKETRRIVSD
jgi:hypothetical protein